MGYYERVATPGLAEELHGASLFHDQGRRQGKILFNPGA